MEGKPGKDAIDRQRLVAAFRNFIQNAADGGTRWKIVLGSDKASSYRKFEALLQEAAPDDLIVLLVDSDTPIAPPTVSTQSPWAYTRSNSGGGRGVGGRAPAGVNNNQVHLMVPDMEAWIMADPIGLHRYFKRRFDASELVPVGDIERTPKDDIDAALARATRNCDVKLRYTAKRGKRHVFLAFREIDPEAVARLPWAKRFVDMLRKCS